MQSALQLEIGRRKLLQSLLPVVLGTLARSALLFDAPVALDALPNQKDVVNSSTDKDGIFCEIEAASS